MSVEPFLMNSANFPAYLHRRDLVSDPRAVYRGAEIFADLWRSR